jgi:Cys-tRNA(Pro)/Cys-tRNA(Cys) deacylase
LDLQQSDLCQGEIRLITNNVTRLLDAKKVAYQVIETPAEKLSAVETAEYLHVPPSLVFKTIVLLREKKGKPILAVVPGDQRVDLKMVADHIGEKKVATATEQEAEHLTGLKVGGISALALLNRGFVVLLDDSAANFKEIIISGGLRGLKIRMGVEDYIAITSARMESSFFRSPRKKVWRESSPNRRKASTRSAVGAGNG